MLFNSYIFILFFCPIALILYFGLNRLGRETGAKCVLIGMSLWFYAYFNVSYLFLIMGSVVFNFIYSRMPCRQKLGLCRGNCQFSVRGGENTGPVACPAAWDQLLYFSADFLSCRLLPDGNERLQNDRLCLIYNIFPAIGSGSHCTAR